MKKHTTLGILLVIIYVLIVTAPLLILLAGPRPAGRDWWRDLSVGLGYCGLSMMGLQFVLTARFRELVKPYGIDIVYFFHRQVSLVAFALVAAHPLLLFIFEPFYLRLLNLFTAPWSARFGVSSALALAVIIVISLWRVKLRIEYDLWRIIHGILAIVASAFAMVHIVMRGYYLNVLWKQVFWVIYAAVWIGLVLWMRVIKPLILIRKAYIVDRVIPEPGSTFTLVLKPGNHGVMRFEPGQFAWLSVGNTPLSDHEHPFSLTSSAEDATHLAFSIKELGDFTSTIKNLTPGQKVYVEGPYGSFTVDRYPGARSFMFIAGGIGITPFISTLRTLADREDRRPLTLIYANKTLDTTTFRKEIDELKSRLNLKLVYVLESPPEGWNGGVGFVNAKVLQQHLPEKLSPDEVEIFICGPGPMMDAVDRALRQLSVPGSVYHAERFDLV